MAEIRPEQLGEAVAGELELYSKEINELLYKAGLKAVKEIVRKTKDTAPFNANAYHTHYADLIAHKSEKLRTGDSVHTWYVKPPGHRLTHLLVHGHDTLDGGRTRADPFLTNALAEVLPEYERAIRRAIEDAGK